MASATATQAAKAINSILQMKSKEDQEGLMEVIGNYFCSSDPTSDSENSDCDSDTDIEDTTHSITSVEDDIGSEDVTDDCSDYSIFETASGSLMRDVAERLPLCSEEIIVGEGDDNDGVKDFLKAGCGCSKWNGKPCCDQFTSEHVSDIRMSMMELSNKELDLILMGQMMASSNTSESVSTENRHENMTRAKAYTNHFHQGKSICRNKFIFLHAIAVKRLKNIIKTIQKHGITPRVHGNTKRLPKKSLSYQSIQYVVKFLVNYVEQHRLLLPGRVPGYKRDDVKLLPSSTTKRNVWQTYQVAAQRSDNIHSVAYTTFCRLWRLLLPTIVMMKPMSDLCWTCQKNSSAILRASNNPESHKSSVLRQAEEHLRLVQIERSYYKTLCDNCSKQIKTYFSSNGVFQPPPLDENVTPNTRDLSVHYSFDYAQQVHYPSDHQQPGPIYFLTPRKCAVFGINCEAIPRQVFFLADEAGSCGKGANVVISQLDYFFSHHGFGEKHVYLHADNCCGQNKNNAMIQYLAWRVLTNKHTNITLSFLVVGHTKFSPDWCFGLFKRLYRRSKVGSLQSIAKVVNNFAQCNFSQLVSTEDGNNIVPTHDWTSYFAPYFKRIKNIKQYHHFAFSSTSPGVVLIKKNYDQPEENIQLLKGLSSEFETEYPSQIHPRGLTAERSWYLFDEIRPFCPEADKDITCPSPMVPKPCSRAGTPVADTNHNAAAPPLSPSLPTCPPPTKKQRLCGRCKMPGHNIRSCPTDT